jgi:hypothetical protein
MLSWAADAAAPAIKQRNDAGDRLIFIKGRLGERCEISTYMSFETTSARWSRIFPQPLV